MYRMTDPKSPAPPGVLAARHMADLIDVHRVHPAYGTHSYRNAVLLELADRYLGTLSEETVAAMGVVTTARRVLMSAETERHAVSRRQAERAAKADLVATRLCEVLANLLFMFTPQRKANTFELIGHSPSAGGMLHSASQARACGRGCDRGR